MFRIWFTVGLSAIVILLTAGAGILADARLVTIFYRMLISMMVFGIIGYFLGGIIQKKFMNFMNLLHSDNQKIDIRADEQHKNDITDELQPLKRQEFQPFAAGDLERVYSNDK